MSNYNKNLTCLLPLQIYTFGFSAQSNKYFLFITKPHVRQSQRIGAVIKKPSLTGFRLPNVTMYRSTFLYTHNTHKNKRSFLDMSSIFTNFTAVKLFKIHSLQLAQKLI